MNKIAFVFPGQGAQIAGMGKDFYENSKTARIIIEEASINLGFDITKLCFQENEQLHKTEYTQVALVAICMAMEAVLREKGIHPDVTAGLSLGEYCAIASAGGMTVQDAILAVRKRGILMEQAVPNEKGAMAAVLGMTDKEIDAVLTNVEGVSVANYNCPGQIVITGWKEKVEEGAELLKEAGAKRVLPLKVSGPFHSPMMGKAGEELRKVLDQVSFKKLHVPYVTNVNAKYVTDIHDAKELLVQQISSSVYWQQSVEEIIKHGVDTFIEIGPGRTLSGFIKKINRNVNIYQVGTWEDLEKVGNMQC